ncbi:MAG: hypothetical protein ACKOFA_06410 [Rhodoluna sp.]
MPKNKTTSVASVLTISALSAVFVGFIGLGSFNNPIRVAIAAGITFVAVLVSLLLLRAFEKDDEVKPGTPRLK